MKTKFSIGLAVVVILVLYMMSTAKAEQKKTTKADVSIPDDWNATFIPSGENAGQWNPWYYKEPDATTSSLPLDGP